jgi:hypothetical protein
VPAIVNNTDATLLAWVAAQGAKGSTIVSICDGALVVANSGLLNGHRATAHWATERLRNKKYPQVHWVKNTRYVADGLVVSSAGISAAMPTALALVEAIAGYERAAALAKELGLADWSPRHNSDVFHPHLGVNIMAFARTQFTNGWFHATEQVGVPIAAGVDEIALALTADAYSRTGRSHAYSLASSGQPLPTRHGLVVVPDRVLGELKPLDVVLPPFNPTPRGQQFDSTLAGIAHRYGRTTAYGVALVFEYPGFK